MVTTACAPTAGDRRRYPFALDRFQLEALDALDAGQPRRRRRTDRQRQDRRRRVRHRGDPPGRPAGLLHGAAQGAVEPEVPRPRRALRRRRGRAAHRRQRDRRRRAGRRDDHRGAAQHDLRPLAGARRPRPRRARRGPLPAGRLPRTGVGGGDHPPAGASPARVPVGDGEQRRRAGGVDPDRPRPDDAGRRAAPPGAPRTTATSSATAPTTACTCCRRSSAAGPNPDAARLDASAVRRGAARRDERPAAGQRPAACSYTPGRVETVELLDQRGLLPAIVFIFSRNQCDEAARTVPGGRAAAHRPAPSATAIRDDRRRPARRARRRRPRVLGYGQFLAQLEAGIAAHHAGMVPAFKEAVEACFIEGLIKVVFATETLAVGVNMPARTVVIEKLTKFTGDHHEILTPGEYTQLTGRAGRRGIDDEGHAVVLWSPFVPFEQVAALGRQPDVPPALGVPPDVQHGRQPRRHVHQRAGPPPAQPVVRPVPGRPRRRPARGPPRAGPGQPRRGPRRRPRARTATSGSTAARRGAARRAAAGATTWSTAGSPGCGRARSSTPPRAGTAGRSPSSPAPTARAACA